MKAAVLFGPGDVRITDFPTPPLAEDGVKVAVAYCGICGTDFHKFAGKAGSRPVTYPVPLGHEASGIVVEVGEKVTDFKVGDRVTVDPNHSCGHCSFCRDGKAHLCSNSRGVVKGMAQFICPPQENVYKLPDSLSLRDAALCEPLSCCIHGMDLLGLKSGETVAIVGCGAIGSLMLQLCRLGGAGKIVVFDANEAKREGALALGASLFINPRTDDVKKVLADAGIGCIHRVIECGGLPVTASLALDVAGRGATVVRFGVSDPEAIVPLKWYDAFTKELVIKTSYINPATTSRAIALLDGGLIDTEAAISSVITLDEFEQELKTRALSSQGKVLVKIDQ